MAAPKDASTSELELILAGSPDELKANIPLLLAIAQIVKFYLNQSQYNPNRVPISPEFKDYIQLTMCWKGISEVTNKNHTVEKSIRLKHIDPHTVTLKTLQDLGHRVVSKFDNLIFKTGHVKCKYASYKDGINTWGYFDKYQTGYHIIESMGDIGGFQINKERFRYEAVLDPNDAFDATPSKVQIAQKSIRPKVKAPIATMKFSHAYITFPWINHSELLCTLNGYVIKSLNFLDAYDD